MDTLERIEDKKEQVHGTGGFPVYLPIVGFILVAGAMWFGSTVVAILGMLMMIGSVIGADYFIRAQEVKTPDRAKTQSSVLRHA